MCVAIGKRARLRVAEPREVIVNEGSRHINSSISPGPAWMPAPAEGRRSEPARPEARAHRMIERTQCTYVPPGSFSSGEDASRRQQRGDARISQARQTTIGDVRMHE